MEIHAHLIVAPTLTEAPIPDDLRQEGPDTRHLVVDSFGVDDARRLIIDSSRTSIGGAAHRFVIVAKAMTHEAQNALLKLFEEPPSNTVFYLIVPHESLLIATLRSRLIKSDVLEPQNTNALATEFLGQSLTEQLDTIATLAKDDPAALGELAKTIAEKTREARPDTKRSLLQTLKYVYNRGASRKMLLEEMVLSLHTKQNT